MNGDLGHLCAHIGYTGPGENPVDMMTLHCRHMIGTTKTRNMHRLIYSFNAFTGISDNSLLDKSTVFTHNSNMTAIFEDCCY